MDSLDDYYFRDSFDHSSSESQLQDRQPGGISHRSSRSQTPQPPPQRLRSGSRGSVNTAAGQVIPAGTVVPVPPPTPAKRFNLVQVRIFLFVFAFGLITEFWKMFIFMSHPLGSALNVLMYNVPGLLLSYNAIKYKGSSLITFPSESFLL